MSLNNSTPVVGKGRSTDRSDERRRRLDDSLRDDDQDINNQEEREEQARQEAIVRDHADDVIRDIQRNKADLAKPTGELNRHLETLLIDMKHFHLTSHVDKKLRDRILQGDFTVDFKRLIPQSRSRCKTDSRLSIVSKDGMSYFVPADKDSAKEINCYKQWEIAFRVFMGIYISKWPARADELLEYSHVIQTASLTYPWESVFNYDIAIREIITENPNCLWGKICQHTWALEIGEPSNKTGVPAAAGQSKQAFKQAKRICWRFNKGRCTFGEQCEYDHKCSVCGGRNHGRHNCYKRAKGEKARDKEVKKEK